MARQRTDSPSGWSSCVRPARARAPREVVASRPVPPVEWNLPPPRPHPPWGLVRVRRTGDRSGSGGRGQPDPFPDDSTPRSLASDHAMRSVDRTWRRGMSRPNEGPRVTDRSSDEGRVPSPDAHVPPPPPAIDLTTPLKPDRLVPWIPLAALGLAILASVTWVLVSSDPSTIHFPDTIEERQRMHSPAFQDLAEGLTMAVPVDSLRPAVAVYGTGEQPSFMVLAYVDSPTVEEYETFWENMSGRLKGSGQGSLKVDSLTRAVYGSTT